MESPTPLKESARALSLQVFTGKQRAWRPSFCKERGKSPTLDFIWTVWLDLPCTETQFVPLKHP
jgi:hypothetical protein